MFGDNAPPRLPVVMRSIVADLKVTPKVTPHDLRRSHATRLVSLGFSVDLMDRILNHREHSVRATYNRYAFSAEIKHAMETVARHIMTDAADVSASAYRWPFQKWQSVLDEESVDRWISDLPEQKYKRPNK